MATFTVNLWLLAVGAAAGAGAVLTAKGRNRVAKGAVIGAVLAYLLGVLRGII